ncbi:hypothetical protein BC833DRAFT_576675 [Globomyces pollinis-pini]|nr:hypothetical protein BC833DRAFT_576675 [Globomyces pollinis-pini]
MMHPQRQHAVNDYQHRDRDPRNNDRRDRDRQDRRRRDSPQRPDALVPPECIPLHLREKKLDFWDQKPEGYETMTADQAKATGLFLLPCHMLKGTGTFGTSAPAPTFGYAAITGGGLDSRHLIEDVQVGRNTRRLYFGNLPDSTKEEELVEWVCNSYENLNIPGSEPGRVALSANMYHEKNYAFVNFRTPEETTSALALDNGDFKGSLLKVRRPKDYMAGEEDPNYIPGVISSVVQDTMFKVFIGGLPAYVTEDQVKDLLQAFGELKSFNLVMDSATGLSKGFAFCEYLNHEITDIACEGLHGLELGDKKLIVQRASVGASKLPMIDGALPGAGLGRPVLPIEILGANGLKPAEPTLILLMLNMLEPEELENDKTFNEILKDIQKECEKFGEVLEVCIPRPNGDKFVAGLGKVYVKFANIEHCSKAQRDLAGRKFDDRTVLTTFFDETKFEARFF